MIRRPDILCIGHVCHDETEHGYILGGSASYCSIVASKLGYASAVLTSAGDDFLFHNVFKENNIALKCQAAKKTTLFHNVYTQGTRIQYLKQRANVISAADLPPNWTSIPVIKFCLIADEVDPALLKHFPGSLIGATIQGWLRAWDKTGKIYPKEMDWAILRDVDVVCMSRDDISGFEDKIPLIASYVKVLVLTDGRHDAEVFTENKKLTFPSYPVKEIDPTGAGDVFAAAFLLEYALKYNVVDAAIFAHCAASLVVEGMGIENLDDLHRISTRIADYKIRFPQFG